MMTVNNYVITDAAIREPPHSFAQCLKFLGPGFILSASIVGSGELIATTVLGARAGFIAFWVIIVSCLVKVAVQLEFGKQAILTGRTAIQLFNRLPGPRLGRGNWALWTALLLALLKIVQIGGITGGAAIVLYMLFPIGSVTAWTFLIAIVASALIFRGYYQVVEKISLILIAAFTITTITAVVVLHHTPYAFSWGDMMTGMTFSLPVEVLAVAVGAFGITGVASDEIIAYTYWCIEKGYAAYTGPRTDSAEWKSRAQGWIRVMYLDAIVAMIIYTLVTAAFYLLGAAILHNRSEIPAGNEVIETIALIYTQTLGPGVKTIYLVGAFFVLFSSVFASLAAWTRLFPDIFGQAGWIDFFNVRQRKRMMAALAWIFPMIWASTFAFIELPVMMILSGGIVGSVWLLVVVYAAIYFRKERIQFLPSGIFYNTAFWISVVSIGGVGVYGIATLFL